MGTRNLAALTTAIVATIAVVIAALALSSSDSDDDVVAVIDGIEITRGEWERSLAQPDEWLDCVREELEHYDGPEADEQLRAVTLLTSIGEGHSPEARTLGMAIMGLAPVAEARERGLEPTDAEVSEEVEATRAMTTSLLEADEIEFPSAICGIREVEARIAAVGEERYWNENVERQQRRSLLLQNLWRAEDAGPGGGAYAWDLVRSADVDLSPFLEDVVTLDEVHAFLDHYERLAKESAGGPRVPPELATD